MKKVFYISLVVCFCITCKNESNPEPVASIPEFVEIVNGKTTITDSLITCEIDLKELADQLKFDNNQLEVDYKEYEWGVYFDNNKDGKYDLAFSITNWKSEEEAERTGTILENTQSNIWILDETGGSFLETLTAKIEGDKIRFEVLDITPEIREISNDSRVKYQAFYNNGSEKYIDSLIIN